jgi:signal transduction histidine kinase
MRRKRKVSQHAKVANNVPVEKRKFELTSLRAVVVLIALLLIVVAIIIGAWIWLLLSVPLVLATIVLSVWRDSYRKPPALLNAIASFFTYATVGMLIIGVECAVFRDIDMFDSQVHWYEEHLGIFVELIENRLSFSFWTLFAITIGLLCAESLLGWKLLKWFSSIRSLIGRASLILAVLTSFTFLNVEMVQGLKPGWLKKRMPEINKRIDELGKKRRHELRLALVREKVEKMTPDDKKNIVELFKIANPEPYARVLVSAVAEDEGDDSEKWVVKDKRYNDQKMWSDTLPENFSYLDLRQLERESKEIEEKNKRDREAIADLFKKAMSGLIPDDLQPILKEFSDALLDGSIDWAEEKVFPERITGRESFDANDERWHLDRPPKQILTDMSDKIETRRVAREQQRADARRRWDEEMKAAAKWREVQAEHDKFMGRRPGEREMERIEVRR